jgi:XTP/dITP diphosphohydrolase
MTKLMIATNNRGKLVEFQELLKDLSFDLVTPAMLGLELDVHETGNTYEENARLKAISFANASRLLSLADDTGLEVDALNGEPGLRSRRFIPGKDAADADRRAYLLQRLQEHPRPWLARFRCVVAIAQPKVGQSAVVLPVGSVWSSEGGCPGQIIPEERGVHGFGYDPIFLLTGIGKTMAELTMEEKNRLSHRARAVHAAQPFLYELLKKD